MELDYYITTTTEMLETATSQEILNAWTELQTLKDLIHQTLQRPTVHLNIKIRKGADYVYANYTSPITGSKTIYLGKHKPSNIQRYEIDQLVEPKPWHYRVKQTSKTKNKSKAWQYTLDENEFEQLHGITKAENQTNTLKLPHQIHYSRHNYLVARTKYYDTLEAHHHPLVIAAEITSLTGLKRLERLQNDGYLIKPL